MKKVYVVLGGDKKNRSVWVSAVFTSKKKAEIYRDWMATMHTENEYSIDTEMIDTFTYGKE